MKQKKSDGDLLTEADLFRMIQGRYRYQEYLVLGQVRSAMDNKARIADALAIGLWKSRDVLIHGFEIKTSRISWIQELQNPAKAEEVAQYCHQWWIVASDASIVDPKELPKSWGLYVAEKSSLKQVVPAPTVVPKPLDSVFVACLLKNAINQDSIASAAGALHGQYETGYKKGLKEGREGSRGSDKRLIELLNDRLHTKEKAIKKLEDMLGIQFASLDWDSVKAFGEAITMYGLLDHRNRVLPEKIKEMVAAHKFLSTYPVDRIVSKLIHLAKEADEIKNFLENKIIQLPELQNTTDWKMRFLHADVRKMKEDKERPTA